jgi:hypothetical protein
MFAGQPQPVEIHHRGIWYSGELIGWRHEGNGRVAARVRCRVDGLRHSAWMDLADLRLPDPQRPPHKEPFPAVVPRRAPALPEEEDVTRPHALLAAMRTGPAKPAHAITPPAAPVAPAADPRRGDRETVPPAARPEPAGEWRRYERLDRRAAYFSAV